MLRVVAFFVVVIYWLAAVPYARAEPARDEGLPAESADYRFFIQRAIEEFKYGNFAEAREHFSRAHALQPSARTMRGLGMSEFELRSYVQAVEKLEEALASTRRPLDGELRTETLALLARANQYVGAVRLQLQPTSMAIRVDGFPAKLDAKGRVRLAVGDHVLDLTADGHASERRAITVRGEQVIELQVTLPNLSASKPASGAPLAKRDTLPQESPEARPPLYKRWWLWTGVGVAVAAGVVAGILVANRDTKITGANGGSINDTLYRD